MRARGWPITVYTGQWETLPLADLARGLAPGELASLASLPPGTPDALVVTSPNGAIVEGRDQVARWLTRASAQGVDPAAVLVTVLLATDGVPSTASPTSAQPTCTCSDKTGCNARIARNLTPFCAMPPPPPRERDPHVFDSYEEAAKALPVGWRVRAKGGLYTGSPRRFRIEPNPSAPQESQAPGGSTRRRRG